MPAKNTAEYIEEAIKSILESGYNDFELIVIDDNSHDNTYEIVKKISKVETRVKVYKNNYTGKVAGLNYGYSLATGDIIKCIDSDDKLSKDFFMHIDKHNEYDAICHNGNVVNENGKLLSSYVVDPYITEKIFEDCFKNLKSLPRWCWSFKRQIAEKLFPMPLSLSFEDIWFSLAIKRFSNKILHLNKELYDYRQHDSQIYGGILNFKSKTIKYRADRILKVINTLRDNSVQRLEIGPDKLCLLDPIEEFYKILAMDNVTFSYILFTKISLGLKARALIYKKLSFGGVLALKLKWKFDRLRAKQSFK